MQTDKWIFRAQVLHFIIKRPENVENMTINQESMQISEPMDTWSRMMDYYINLVACYFYGLHSSVNLI